MIRVLVDLVKSLKSVVGDHNMADRIARMTYMGSCVIDGVTIRCTSMSGGIETSPAFHDHVVGLRDKNFEDKEVKESAINDEGGVGGFEQIQKKIYRFTPGIFKAKISGPISESDGSTNIKNLFDKAITGKFINSANFTYQGSFAGGASLGGHSVNNLYVESFGLNIVAGDIASFDAGFVAKEEPTAIADSPAATICEKLLTWDQCNIKAASIIGEVQAFSISIKNNVIPIYTSINPEALVQQYIAPKSINFGIQDVSGVISTYGFMQWQKYSEGITIKLGGDTWVLNVVYSPTASSASGSDVYISSTPFNGVSDGKKKCN